MVTIHMEDGSCLWFAFGWGGEIYPLDKCKNFDEAEEKADDIVNPERGMCLGSNYVFILNEHDLTAVLYPEEEQLS